jgi:hypothetical protein
MNRRVFLGSAAVVGSAGAAGWFGRESVVVAQPLRDAMDDELRRQLKEGIRAIGGSAPGEALRRFAGSLRLYALHHQARGLDQQLQRAIRTAIARAGRESLLQQPVDSSMLRAELKPFGLTPIEPDTFDYEARVRTLDSLLKSGVTPHFVAVAAALERFSGPVEQLAGRVRPVARQPEAIICDNFRSIMSGLQAAMVFACSPWALLTPQGEGACAGLVISYAATGAAYLASGCR